MKIKELLEDDNDDLDNIADGTTRSHPIEDDEDDFDHEDDDVLDDPARLSDLYIYEMVLAIDENNPEEFDSNYDAARNYQSEKTLLKVIAEYIGSMEPNKPNEKAHLIKFVLGLIKGEFEDSAQTVVRALRINQVNWPELAVIQKSLDALNEGKNAANSITDGSDRRKYIALRNMEADRLAKAKATNDPIKQSHHRKMAQTHNDDANIIMNKYRNKPVSEDKIKGADGKACWKGYRYAGTKNGKDKCVKVNEMGLDTAKKGLEKGKAALDKLQYKVATSQAGQNWNEDVLRLLRKIKRSNPKLANIAQKYIDFGNTHPKWQTFILTILTAFLTAGVATTLGGAEGTIAALGARGLVDLTNNLLKGKKFTDAAIQAGLASGAGQVGGDVVKGMFEENNESPRV